MLYVAHFFCSWLIHLKNKEWRPFLHNRKWQPRKQWLGNDLGNTLENQLTLKARLFWLNYSYKRYKHRDCKEGFFLPYTALVKLIQVQSTVLMLILNRLWNYWRSFTEESQLLNSWGKHLSAKGLVVPMIEKNSGRCLEMAAEDKCMGRNILKQKRRFSQ